MLYWIYYFLSFIATLLGWLILIATSIKIALGRKRFQKLKNRYFAALTVRLAKTEMKDLQSTKEKLFSDMKELKSADPELLKKKALNILEVGVGNGTNLEFYPAGSRLTCVDPNEAFEPYFRRECAQRATHLDPDIRFVLEPGEDMASVPDGSMDVVVITLVLCSVQRLETVLKEVLRVLVPGGKFYYLEHMGDAPGTFRRRLQDVLSDSELWPIAVEGCRLNCDTEQILQKSAFSSVDQHTTIVVNGKMLPRSTPEGRFTVLNPILYGVATK